LTFPTPFRKALAVLEMKRLDAAARRERISREQSLHGTVGWLLAAQDGTADDGVSYGYSLHAGWEVSYPETTGYILQTLLWYRDLFAGERWDADMLMQRASRMAHWEVDVQMESGATPGNYGTPPLVPVAFNTGQVLLGWAEYLRRVNDARIRDAAHRAARWLIECLNDKPWFQGGVSAQAQHGNLSYNSMVSWGLAEIAEVLGEQRFLDAAVTSARHYAGLVNERHWPYRSGFSDADSEYPLTHTLGYSIQGFIEVGRIAADGTLVLVGKNILEAARPVIDSTTGFLPGRVRPNWQDGSNWACLTGSAQFAYSLLRLVLMRRGEDDYLEVAGRLIDYVVATQVTTASARPDVAFGVRGSYPFRFGGYQVATQLNWAAKFLVDAEMLLYRLGKL
jgi:hypothetical protein